MGFLKIGLQISRQIQVVDTILIQKITSDLRQSGLHWGRGGLETNENILSTLQALVEGTRHLPADNRLGTF